MNFSDAMANLRAYVPVAEMPCSLFLLPEEVMSDLHHLVVKQHLRSVLELGSGFGATSCVLAAALQETGGHVTTVDMFEHVPANPRLLKAFLGLGSELEIVVDPLGYNWWLAAMLQSQAPPAFDLVFLDGAHRWEPDALASLLAIRLLKPGGWFVLDDINFNLRSMAGWQATHGHLSDRELDSYQLAMVWNLIITSHPDLQDQRIIHDGRIGWARKRQSVTPSRTTSGGT